MDSLPEVLVITDSKSTTHNCTIYDMNTGVSLSTLKGGNSTKHGLAFIGDDYLISALQDKPYLKVWTVNKCMTTSEECRMVMPGIVSCLAVTSCGSYCVAGIDKSIFLWEVSTGTLLNSLHYHSKTVTCLRFTDDGSHFISGSGDGMVLVWFLSDAAAESEISDHVKPHHTWMDHSAKVTDIFVGGANIHARIATASEDMTCRWYELESGLLLLTVRVDYAITAVTMDALEYFMILGSAEGNIYRINLFSAEEPELSYSKTDTKSAFIGHSKEITCLSLSLSGKYLLSGSGDSDCRVWDMANFSCMRTLSFSGPITNAFIALLPPGLNSNEKEVCPKLNISVFQRQYTKDKKGGFFMTQIQPRKLSLFHVGAPDNYFDSRIVANSEDEKREGNKLSLIAKDVNFTNRKLYTYCLNAETLETTFKRGDNDEFDNVEKISDRD